MSLRVESLGGVDVATHFIRVAENPIPCTVPSISIHPESQTIAAGERATLSVTASSDSPISYRWIRGGLSIGGFAGHETDDGKGRTFQTPALDHPETYHVQLQDFCGTARSELATVTVVHSPPVASFTWTPASPIAGEIVQFTDTSTYAPASPPTSRRWDFGDGDRSSFPQNPGHRFLDAGTYEVSLRVENPGGVDVATHSIVVKNAPPCTLPSISVHPESQTIAAGERATLSVTASSDTPINYQWLRHPGAASSNAYSETDNGRSSTFRTPELSQTTRYQLQVTNSCFGVIFSEVATVTVVHSPPVASFIWTPTSPITGEIVQFIDTSIHSPQSPSTSWRWDFGDGHTWFR